MPNSKPKKMCGDVDYDSCVNVASAITPVPGGVGPMTMAMLLSNIMRTYNVQRGITATTIIVDENARCTSTLLVPTSAITTTPSTT